MISVIILMRQGIELHVIKNYIELHNCATIQVTSLLFSKFQRNVFKSYEVKEWCGVITFHAPAKILPFISRLSYLGWRRKPEYQICGRLGIQMQPRFYQDLGNDSSFAKHWAFIIESHGVLRTAIKN